MSRVNAPGENPRLPGLRRVLLVAIAAWLAFIVVSSCRLANRWQAASPPSLPYGVFVVNGVTYTKDFSYNLLYFHGIQDRQIARPYRLDEQEAFVRRTLPEATSGMTHAYSPVAFVLAMPLLDLSGSSAYAIYTALAAAATFALFCFYLFPRAREPAQLGALTLSVMSVWVVTTFTVGQTAPITTAAMALFWALLSRRDQSATLVRDGEIAALFWVLCLKPSVAILPIILLLGMKAWRPFLLGLLVLALTWAGLCGYYGGFWRGLGDYWHLVNHYNNSAFSPYMQRAPAAPEDMWLTSWRFAIERDLVLLTSAVLIALRWTDRLSASGLFQGSVWMFLVLSPYLMPTENWILLLLVVEGTFFLTRGSPLGYVKLTIVVAIFHLRAYVTFPIAVDVYLKTGLAVWCLAETFLVRPRSTLNAHS